MKSAMSGLRVAFVAPQAWPLLTPQAGGGCGGAERQLFLFARHLRTYGPEVLFITDRTGNPTSMGQLPFLQTPFTYLGGSKHTLPLNWFQLWVAAYRSRATHFIIKTPAHLLVPLGLFCRLFGRRLVFWAQTTRDMELRRSGLLPVASRLQNLGMRWAHGVIAQTNRQQQAFEDQFGRSARRVASIVDTLMPSGSPSDRASLPRVDVLWAGNDTPNKQAHLLIDLARQMPQFRFAMALNRSHSNRFNHLQNLAAPLPNLDFLGQVLPSEMDLWFKRCRLLVNTSLREGFPNTFLQAWQQGVPVVSLHVDPDDLIEDKGLGWAANPDTPAADRTRLLIQAVAGLLEDDGLRQKTGIRCRDYVAKYHSPEVVVPQLIRALTRLSP